MKTKRIRAGVALLTALAACSLLPLTTGCGLAGSGSLGNPTSVLAQTTYATASLSGTYSVNEFGITGTEQHDGTGTLSFDGNGHYTGTVTDYYIGSAACKFTITGTYTVSNDGSGTANTTSTALDPGAGCSGTTGTFNLMLAQQGQTVVFAETDGQRLDTGTVVKQ